MRRMSLCFLIAFIVTLCWGVRSSLPLCSVSSLPLNFGAYDPLSDSPADTEGSIAVDCDEAPPPLVTISLGPSPSSGSFDPRTMNRFGGSDRLSYNLYTDAPRRQIWGNGTGATVRLSRKVNKNSTWNAEVYGRILPGQDVSAGSYADTLSVIIDW